MPQQSPEDIDTVPTGVKAYLRKALIIPGRPLIPGRRKPTFPSSYRVEDLPVTFGSGDAAWPRGEYVIEWIKRTRNDRRLIMLMIPHAVYSDARAAVFHYGWTLLEHELEVRTHQCVVFLSGDAVPIGRSDQGVICVARRTSLSAWSGRTQEQSRARAS